MKKFNFSEAITFYIVNLIVLTLFNLVYSENVVLGNIYFKGLLSFLWPPLILTVLIYLAKQVVGNLQLPVGRGKYSMLGTAIAINIVVLWLMARIPSISSMGISSYVWAIVIGLVAAVLQWWVWVYFEKP